MEETIPRHVSSATDATGIFLVVVTILVFLLPMVLWFPPVAPSHTDALLQTHVKFGILNSEIESSIKTSKSLSACADACARPQPSVAGLTIHPIRSCAGISLHQSKVLHSGLEYDSLFTFAQLTSSIPVSVSDATGKYDDNDNNDEEREQNNLYTWTPLTLLQLPLLATLSVSLFVPDAIKCRGNNDMPSRDAFLVVRFPWQDRGPKGLLAWVAAKLAGGRLALPEREMLLPVGFPFEREVLVSGYRPEEVAVTNGGAGKKKVVMALNMSAETPEELRLYLGWSNKLAIFRLDESEVLQPLRLVNLSSLSQLTPHQLIAQSGDGATHDATIFVTNLPPLHTQKPNPTTPTSSSLSTPPAGSPASSRRHSRKIRFVPTSSTTRRQPSCVFDVVQQQQNEPPFSYVATPIYFFDSPPSSVTQRAAKQQEGARPVDEPEAWVEVGMAIEEVVE